MAGICPDRRSGFSGKLTGRVDFTIDFCEQFDPSPGVCSVAGVLSARLALEGLAWFLLTAVCNQVGFNEQRGK